MSEESAITDAPAGADQPQAGPDEAEPEDADAGARSQLKVLRAPEVLDEQVRPLFRDRGVRVIGARVVESLEQADIEVERARSEAASIIAGAREEAEEIREQAREAGRAEGLEEVVALIAKARSEYTEMVDDAKEDMLELAFRLARRIVGEAIELEPTLVQDMVTGVLRHARGKRQIAVSVCPDDLAVLEASADQMSKRVDGVPVHFEADQGLVRGSCVIQTESGRIDGRIETQLETLMRALRGE